MVEADRERERQIAYFREKYELNPQSRVFAPLADLHRQSGDLETAADLLQEGLSHHPDFVAALIILGQTRAAQGDDGSARSAWQRVMALDPDNVVALALLAADARERSAWSVAAQLYQRLVRLDPVDEEAVARLREARACVAEESAQATAEETAEEVVEEADEEAAEEMPAPAANTLPVPEPPAAGISGTPAAAAASPASPADNRLATVTLAEIYMAQGYRDKAIAVLQTLLERDPDRPDILEQMAAMGMTPPVAAADGPEFQEPESEELVSDAPAPTEAAADGAAPAHGRGAAVVARDDEGEREGAVSTVPGESAKTIESAESTETTEPTEAAGGDASVEIAPSTTGPLMSPPRRLAVDQRVEQNQFASWLKRIKEQREDS